VVVIEEESPGNVFLYRLTREGEFGGDAWRQRVEDAMYQARYEYAEALGEWREVPAGVGDAKEFVVAAARREGQDGV
jgi:hypothetical protein